MNRRLLSGVRVLVGRARHQASVLSAELRKHGAHVIEIPFIEIRKPRSFKPLDRALKSLREYDWLILTSVNGAEAMWERLGRLKGGRAGLGEGHDFSRAAQGRKQNTPSAAETPRSKCLRVAAIGPATKRAIERRGIKVEVVPREYVAESVVRSLRRRVKGKRVLLIRAQVARDVIPRELRQAGAHVDVVEAYETVVPRSSRSRLRAALNSRRPDVITFTSSSTVRNFVALLGGSSPKATVRDQRSRGRGGAHHTWIDGVQFASIGPVTSATLQELGFPVHIEAKQYTIPGLVDALVKAFYDARAGCGISVRPRS
jgi:uroporphyrinogen-III synthase